MCGIAGYLVVGADATALDCRLQAMADALAHRGPDAQGLWRGPGVALVHRRLSIIDLSSGDQPIGNEDGSIQVVFNGEIYNYRDLRDELIKLGHRFRTQSDTEVLVHLYEQAAEHGSGDVEQRLAERYLARLRGMFAFALWDGRRRQLILARDRLGIKPLYYYRDSHRLIFASELKALLVHADVPREVLAEALADYLTYGLVPGGKTIFRHIGKLPPAGFLVVRPEEPARAVRRYWQLTMAPESGRSIGAWQEAIRAKLDEVVRLHLIADVPVGAFLSGGIDSSVLVALAAGQTQGQLRTFSMGFHEEDFSELPQARRVAEQFGTLHTEQIVTPDAARLVDELSYYYDEPFADSSAVPTYLVSRLASRSVKVVLSGDGGDEAFGGYARYAHDLAESRWRRRLPRWLRRTVLASVARVYPKADWLPRPLRAQTRLTNLSLEAWDAYANTLSLCRPHVRRRLLHRDLSSQLDGYRPEELIADAFQRAPAGDDLAGMISADVRVILPDDFLVKVDRASMACGLEVRPPFLDHELLELAARIPSELKVRQGRTKWILRETYRHLLPAGIADLPKHGFEIPVDQWLREPLRDMVEDTLLSAASPVAPYINVQEVRRLYERHRRGWGQHGQVLWSLLMLARWAERYARRR
ncbi:MAG: asparagine synthase (glutamine-hydrolyzing) [Gemmataceae bacterium]